MVGSGKLQTVIASWGTPWETSNPNLTSWEVGGNPVWSDLAAAYDPNGLRGLAGSANPDLGYPRHFTTLSHKVDNTTVIEVLYSSRGDIPERIFRVQLNTSSPNWREWGTVRVTGQRPAHEMILSALHDWEGGGEAAVHAKNGKVAYGSKENSIRDPSFFTDADGAVY